MICYVCDKDNWHSMGDINPQKELRICKDCGNAAYKIEDDEEKKMFEYYKNEYRPGPNVQNLFTTNRKLQYIKLFLEDFLKDKKGLVCCDIGAATGYLCDYLRKQGHKPTGTEYTKTFRRFSEHFYGVPLTEEIVEKHRYDFISMYHTLEHMIKPDEKLKKYVSLLADGGHMLISTPRWFDVLEEASGSPTVSFEHLFHTNHINVFSKTSLQNLFKKVGLKIIKEDQIVYGQTYLLQKDEKAKGEIVKENWEEIKNIMLKQRDAINLNREKKYKEAIDVYPIFPEAYINLVFDSYMKVPDKQEEAFKKAFEILPDNLRLKQAYVIHLYRTERYEECLNNIMMLNTIKPNEDNFMYMGFCMYFLGKRKEAIQAFTIAQALNPTKFVEAMNWSCKCANELPTWDEMALEQMKQKIKEDPKFKPELKVFEDGKPKEIQKTPAV